VSKSFLDVTEQMTASDSLPSGISVYEVDGHVVWATRDFANYLMALHDAVQDYINNHPFENEGDCQEATYTLCLELGLLLPCYGRNCTGCDDEDCSM
jgi:hypothetical protein